MGDCGCLCFSIAVLIYDLFDGVSLLLGFLPFFILDFFLF